MYAVSYLLSPPLPSLHSCCNAVNTENSALPSCSRPRTYISSPSSNENFCPAPPSLPLSAGNSEALDSNNTYVAERLLREAARLTLAVFFRRFQAGFTFTPRDPIYSVCDCEFDTPNVNNSGACSFLNTLVPCDPAGEDCSVFSLFTATCPNRDQGNFSRDGLCNRTEDSCYSVDPISADIARVSY